MATICIGSKRRALIKILRGNFDVNMTAEIAEDIDNYNCFYYRKARKNYKLSGTNDDMRNFCEKPFEYFYHLKLKEAVNANK